MVIDLMVTSVEPNPLAAMDTVALQVDLGSVDHIFSRSAFVFIPRKQSFWAEKCVFLDSYLCATRTYQRYGYRVQCIFLSAT
jgi:hypothetical protein